MPRKYLLVMRHAKKGQRSDAVEVARALADQISESKGLGDLEKENGSVFGGTAKTDVLDIDCVYAPGDDPKVRATGRAVAGALGKELRSDLREVVLGPPMLSAYGIGRHDKAMLDALCTIAKACRSALNGRPDAPQSAKPEPNAIVVVGNAPAVDWLIAYLCRGRSPRMGGLAHAEMVCLSTRAESPKPSWRLEWVLSPSSAGQLDRLRSKVVSKMTVVGIAAGFLLAATVQVLAQTPPSSAGAAGAHWTSAALFAVAAVGLATCLLAYDRLLMPPRFWTGPLRTSSGRTLLRSLRGRNWPGRFGLFTRPIPRPPSSADWIVYQESVRVWRWVQLWFVVAGVGLVAFAMAALWDTEPDDAKWAGAALFVVALAVGFAWWHRVAMPHLGVED